MIIFDSKGPIIFRQKRYGINGKSFNILKFRSMKLIKNYNINQATKNDERITKVGRILRKLSLDELPQIVNVFFGDMSFVGPRPHAVEHNEEYRKLIKGYMQRHSLKPGITGLAQVEGFRGETPRIEDMEKRVYFDLKYQKEQNLFLDLKILIKTFFTLISSKAY